MKPNEQNTISQTQEGAEGVLNPVIDLLDVLKGKLGLGSLKVLDL